ncbi:MAG TPA: hypothetical protein VKD00_06970 [Methyloceanibacter sp.]|nr:hypothetical protein [Methyloceanibacter sp.]
MTTPPEPSKAKQLLAKYNRLTQELEDTQLEMMAFIREALGDMTPYQFAAASGINKGNLYAMISHGRWNAKVALEALDLLDEPITSDEIDTDPERDN